MRGVLSEKDEEKEVKVFTGPDVEGVEPGAVEDSDPHPGEEEDEVAVVEVAHAVASEHAVVLPLQHTHAAHCTQVI